MRLLIIAFILVSGCVPSHAHDIDHEGVFVTGEELDEVKNKIFDHLDVLIESSKAQDRNTRVAFCMIGAVGAQPPMNKAALHKEMTRCSRDIDLQIKKEKLNKRLKNEEIKRRRK